MNKKQEKETAGKSIQELRKMVADARKALLTITLDHAKRNVKNTRSLFHKRKEIAIFLTRIREQELTK